MDIIKRFNKKILLLLPRDLTDIEEKIIVCELYQTPLYLIFFNYIESLTPEFVN